MCKPSTVSTQSSSSSSSMKADTSISPYAFAGNAAHLLCLASTITFAVMVATKFHTPFFDASWRQDGFCVTNLDVPYWNSHDACLYFDTAAALVLTLIYYWLQQTPGMDAANEQMKVGIPGILAHGIGHGSVAAQMRAGTTSAENAMLTAYEAALATRGGDGAIITDALKQLPGIIFWLALLKASMPNVKNSAIVAMSAVAMMVQLLWTPQIFGFTYVQTVLMVAFSVNQLLRPAVEKDTFAYALYPSLVGFPLTLIGWMESTQCTSFVKDSLYGHLAYDGFIPLSVLGWYLACYFQASSSTSSNSTILSSDKIKTV